MNMLLDIKDLHVEFPTQGGVLHAVDGVSLTLEEGEVLGIVGESGSGKSVTMMALMGLVGFPGRVRAQHMRFAGKELLGISDKARRALVGKEVAMIFQEPTTSLNPCFTIGFQLMETLRLHLHLDRRTAKKRATELLEQVGIPAASSRLGSYPHQLSGGMRQRVMIALALACNPEVLIADEPTTALDVTIQAQILDLIKRLQKELGMGVVMITHDLGVVAESCDRVVVMYAGKKVEEADVVDLFDRPLHPYTRALMASMPSMNTASTRLAEIPGLVPAAHELGRGCAFAARCSQARERCRAETPHLTLQGGDHVVACFAVEEQWADAAEVSA